MVYAVSDLDSAVQEFEKKLGIQPIFGGYHTTQGTKNSLINLGNECYLELLAVDSRNAKAKPPRWMGVDVLTKDRITRFALKSNRLEADKELLKTYNPQMGIVAKGSRDITGESRLAWELTMPLATPEVDTIPFLIDWSSSQQHPSLYLPDMKCSLIKLYATHPNPEEIKVVYDSLNCQVPIKKHKEISLKMILGTPKGVIEL
ncbi:VOC family protein [Aquimarina sp. RZ0]|uniref:VOC family protein n=1 Tax=Aquimarina sp. RZ0 TaxID=2607730 RepID=UPI0021072FA2|nr:VOC family protein [Aquimarina sp. RZ0]